MELYGLSDRGRVRANNEDMLRLEPGLDAALVADGVGGERCGEVASTLAVEAAARALRAGASIEDVVREANDAVWRRSREEVACQGMGTTLVVARRSGDLLEVASVGDSRAYLFREGALVRLTQDQNLYEELRAAHGFTHEEASAHPRARALTEAVGVRAEVRMRSYAETLVPGDTVLVCSDGLYGPVPEDEITRLLGLPRDLARLAEGLVDAANERGGPDNITLALMRIAT